MDNVCHTLVGAAFAEAGLKARTRFGSPVLMIAANLPDVDVLAFASGIPSVAFRRGWTHGVLAQLLLPAVFTALILMVDRLWRPRPGAPPARAMPILLLSYAGVFSHVFLDWLNTYGIRVLMSFSPQWFYGDAVFIIDPWLWLALGFGVFIARHRRAHGPARVALIVAAVYIGAMIWSARTARALVTDAWIRARGSAPHELMVGPVPLNPVARTIIVDDGTYYERGTLSWWPARITFDGRRVPQRAGEPAVARAREMDADMRAVLTWARFPYYEVEPVDGGTRVTLLDMRFGARLGSVSVVVPR